MYISVVIMKRCCFQLTTYKNFYTCVNFFTKVAVILLKMAPLIKKSGPKKEKPSQNCTNEETKSPQLLHSPKVGSSQSTGKGRIAEKNC